MNIKDEFDNVMVKRTDAELIEILNSPSGDYQQDALGSAKKEFKRRNLSDHEIGIITQEIQQKSQKNQAKANEPLPTIWKILAFIFPGVMQIIFSGVLKAEGYDRKFNEFVRWTIYGIFFYGTVILLTIILVYSFHL